MDEGEKANPNYAIRLAENIALLSILNQVPERIAPNPKPSTGSDKHQRSLSFEQENGLCTALAFLTGINDEYQRGDVMAVAVEEHRHPSQIHIKLAINKSTPGSRETTLATVVEGFNKIFKVLSKAAMGDPDSSSAEVLRQVISLSRSRILKRLRSVKAKRTKNKGVRKKSTKAKNNQKEDEKPALASLLRSLDNALESSAHDEFKTRFHRKSALLIEMLEAFETTDPGPEENLLLQHIVEETGHFLKAIDLDQVPDQLEHLNKQFDRNFREFLKERLTKVGHYRTVAVFLFKQAQELELFRDFRIETVCNPPTLLPTADAQSKVNFNTFLQEFAINPRKRESLIAQIRDNHKKDKSFDLVRLFITTASNTLSSGKVHSEVQLLFHYETNPVTLRPRVIASTKSACFLCNTLFRIHDKFYIPRSHGKIYPGWLLPGIISPSGNTLSDRLNAQLQELNRKIIGKILSKAPRERLYSGNESFVHELNVTISSLASSIVSALTTQANQATASSLPVLPKASSRETIRPVIAKECSLEKDSSVEAGGDDSDTDTTTSHSVVMSPPQSQLSIFKHDTSSSINLRSPEPLQKNDTRDELPSSSVTSDQKAQSPSCKEACQESLKKTVSHKSSINEQAEPASTRLIQGVKVFLTLRPDQASSHVFTDFLNIFLDYPGKGIASSGGPALPVVAEVEWLAGQQSANAAGDMAHDVRRLSTQSEITYQAHGQILLRAGDEIVRIGRKLEPSQLHV